MLLQGTDLTSLDGIGQLFTSGGAVVSTGAGANSSNSSSSQRHYTDTASGSPPLNAGERSSSNSGGSQLHSNGSGSDGANDGDSSGNQDGHNDNSSSDSADAASAASTWPHAAAHRRGSKDANQSKHSMLAPRRHDSPPENDSNSGDSNSHNGHSRNDSTEVKSDEMGDGSPTLDPADSGSGAGSGGAGGGSTAVLPPKSVATAAIDPNGVSPPGELRQGLIELPVSHAAGWGASGAGVPPQLLQQLSRSANAGPMPAGMLRGADLSGAAGGGGGVLQGVLPFPGQGIVDLQQGVIVGGALEEFIGQKQGVLSGPTQGVIGSGQGVLSGPSVGAPHAQPHGESNGYSHGYSGEPPAKRAAASSLDAAAWDAQDVSMGEGEGDATVATGASGVSSKAVSRARAEFGCEGGAGALATASAMDTSADGAVDAR